MNNTSIKYDAVIDICDRINAVVRDLNEQFEKVNSFSNSRSGFWKGTAANKFYNEISKKYKEIPEVTEKTFKDACSTAGITCKGGSLTSSSDGIIIGVVFGILIIGFTGIVIYSKKKI